VLALSTLPYLAAWLQTPEDKRFLGALINSEDISTFISAMRQGQDGEWLYHFAFSPEAWQPKLMHVTYLLVGKLAGFVGGDLLLWFHLYRLAAAGFVLLIILFWVRTLFPGKPRLQLTGWFLIVFSGGIGWLAAMLNVLTHTGIDTPDLTGPEWTVFMGILHTPHYALGLGIEIALFACVARMLADNASDWRWTALAAVFSLLSSLTYVYHIPVVGLVVGFSVLGVMWQRRRVLWRLGISAAIVLLPATLLLIYYVIFANQDPYFSYYSQVVHVIPPPSPLGVVVGLGFLAVMALAGLRRWFENGRSRLVPVWAAINILLLYVPVTHYMGRFVLGLIVPVATLAAYGLEYTILPYLEKRPFYHRFSQWTPTPYASLRRIFLFLVIPTAIIIPFWLTRDVVQHSDFPTYVLQSEVDAVRWLSENTQAADLILSDYPMGNYLPRESESKVFVGHFHFTTDVEEKQALVNRFWQTDTSPAWRQALLDTWGIDYVYEGTYEKRLGDGAVPIPGNIVYENDTVTIYQVAEEGQ
jgi:hypothetical protein